ncbi:60S ribosomal export protein NMD3 [Euphorbia peplus]|nr:60S ribosomal export protein NMD3 [Euphorbia peplus]
MARGQIISLTIVRQASASRLCHQCGVTMEPHAPEICARFLSEERELITECLRKHTTIRHCSECDAYLERSGTWIKAQSESKELSECCIKLLHLPYSVRVVNAEFIRTKPAQYSIRGNKLRLIVRLKILGQALEHSFVAEFLQLETLCGSCIGVLSNPDQWVASVQLRAQHVHRSGTSFLLERLIFVGHGDVFRAIKVNLVDQGMDFFFRKRSHSVKFVELLSKVAPVKSHTDKQLVSHDTYTNKYSHKFTFCVEIPPISEDDLICLPPNANVTRGNFGPIVICTNVANGISLLDPLTLRECYLDADMYWRVSFKPLLTSRQLVEYMVLDVETIDREWYEVRVSRLSDFGRNDKVFSVKTHLGRILKPGDQALGYDLYGANINEFELGKHEGLVLPEAILVDKSYKEMRRCREARVSS